MNRFAFNHPNQVLAWIALMSGMQVIILWLNVTLPVVGYWLTYLLPFITLMVFFFIDWRGFLIYSLTSILLVMMLVQPIIETTLFYLLPSWLLGIGYGIALKKKASLLSLLVFLSIIQFAILALIYALTLEFYQLDLLAFIYQIFNLDRNTNVVLLDPILIYAIALLQVLIGLLFIYPLIERFKLPIQYQLYFSKNELICFYGLFIGTLLLLIFVPSLAFFGVGPLALFTIYSYVYFFMKPASYAFYLLLMGLILYPFIHAIFSSFLIGPYRIFSVLFLSIFPMIIALFNSITQKRENALI